MAASSSNSPQRVLPPASSNAPTAAAARASTATAMAGQQTATVPISYTYGSAALPMAGLDYEPPAKTRARERVQERQRSQSRRSESESVSVSNETTALTADTTAAGAGAGGDATVDSGESEGSKKGRAPSASAQDDFQRRDHASSKSAVRIVKASTGTMAITNVGGNGAAAVAASSSGSTSTHNAAAAAAASGGRGASLLQTHPDNKSNALKDTSVNIATAFRQAARPPNSSTAASFLGRAGDRPPAYSQQQQQHSYDHDDGASYVDDSEVGDANGGEDQDISFPESTKETQLLGASTNSFAAADTSNSSKKRKKQHFKGVKEKDGAFRISKDELNAPDSDDQDYSGEEEEEFSEGGTRRPPADWMKKSKTRRKKAKKTGAPVSAAQEGSDAAAAAAAGRKKASIGSRRKSSQKDPAYKPSQDPQPGEEEDYSDGRQKPRRPLGPRRVPIASQTAASDGKEEKPASPEQPTESSAANGARGAGARSVTSFYLQAPSSDAGDSALDDPANEVQPLAPEFKTREQARLTQVHPKSSNGGTTYQPYFAFSTTTTTASAGPSRRFNTTSTTATLARAGNGLAHQRNLSLGSTSQASSSAAAAAAVGQQNESASLLANITQETGPSSNASFENRGSEYDYAAEEELAAALYKAKQSGRPLPEGRPFSQLVGAYDFSRLDSSVNGRDTSLAPSDGSSSVAVDALAHQQQKRASALGGPKRAPAPPGPSEPPSVLSDSQAGGPPSLAGSANTADSDASQRDRPARQQLPQKNIGRKLGEATRALLLALHWLTVGPVKAAIQADWHTLGKWAAAVVFIGLMLGQLVYLL